MPSVQELVGQLGHADQAVAFKAHKDLQEMVMRATAPGKESERAAVSAALAEELNRMTAADKTPEGKEVPPRLVHNDVVRSRVARLMGYVLTPTEVPALEQAMNAFGVREAVLFALELSPLPQAHDALIRAMEAVGPEFRIGVVHALARKGTPQAQEALRAATGDDDPRVAIAAVEALAACPDPANDAYMVRAGKCGCPVTAARAAKARLRLAEALQAAGKKADAARIYRSIAWSNAPETQKKAARRALAAGK